MSNLKMMGKGTEGKNGKYDPSRLLVFSSSKSLASENKEFAFWVDLVASTVPVISLVWFVSYCIGERFYPMSTQKDGGCGFTCHKKKKGKCYNKGKTSNMEC